MPFHWCLKRRNEHLNITNQKSELISTLFLQRGMSSFWRRWRAVFLWRWGAAFTKRQSWTHCGGGYCPVPAGRLSPGRSPGTDSTAAEGPGGSHAPPHVSAVTCLEGKCFSKLQLFGPTSRDPDSSAPQFADYLYLGTTSIKNCCSFCSLSEYPHIKLAPQEIAYWSFQLYITLGLRMLFVELWFNVSFCAFIYF